MSFLELIEQAEAVRVPEPHVFRLEITGSDHAPKVLVFASADRSLSDVEALIKLRTQQLLSIDDDLNRYRHEQAKYTHKRSIEMMDDMISLTLKTRMDMFADRERLQALVDTARKGALGYV